MRVSLRPDPSNGVFETMLVVDGCPIELDAHLERLSESLLELYGCDLPDRSAAAVREAAAGVRHGKLRLTAIQERAGWVNTRIATAEVDAEAVFPAPERGARLRSFAVEKGLGAHKWVDRRLLDHAAAGMSGGELPLLVDREKTVLEVSRASVFCVRDGAIATPPLDGRILPSIARRQALAVARMLGIEAQEEPLELEELLAAEEVFLSGSVRGIESVREIDGVELAAGSSLSELVAAGLRSRWLEPQAEPVAAGASGQPSGRPGR